MVGSSTYLGIRERAHLPRKWIYASKLMSCAVVQMATSQVVFRIDTTILRRLDGEIQSKGYKSRNEWFRSIVRRTIEADDEFLKRIAELAREKGITDEQVMKACRKARHEVYKEVYGDD